MKIERATPATIAFATCAGAAIGTAIFALSDDEHASPAKGALIGAAMGGLGTAFSRKYIPENKVEEAEVERMERQRDSDMLLYYSMSS